MKNSTKFVTVGAAMIATLGVVGAVQAKDRNDDRGPGYHHGEHHRGDRDGRHHRRGHDGERGERGHHRHHGPMGMMGAGMGGMGAGMGGPGHGMGHRMMMMRVFQLADTDGDRSVTQEDLDTFLRTSMEKYDANGDGQLQLDEYKQFFAELVDPMAVRTFQFLDPDGDAALTADEFDKPLKGVVERMDRDGDGKLTMQDRGRFNRDGKRGEGRRGWQRNAPDRQMQGEPDDTDDGEEDAPAAQ